MFFNKHSILIIFLVCLGLFVYAGYAKWSNVPVFTKFYEAEKPQYRDIKQVVTVSGLLEVKNLVKVSSQITGNIKAFYVKENDFVQEGQLLAEIDTPLGDLELVEAQVNYDDTLDRLKFFEKDYNYHQDLFNHQLIFI